MPRRVSTDEKKDRKYFDSGDFALSAAGETATDNGVIQTGSAHPLRENISRPYAPVPDTSNINKDANKDINDKKGQSLDMKESPLHQQNNNALNDDPITNTNIIKDNTEDTHDKINESLGTTNSRYRQQAGR